MSESQPPARSHEGFVPNRVLIVGYSYDAPQIATEVADYLRSKGISSSILDKDPWNEPPGAYSASIIDGARTIAASSDLIIVLGGDGSFLRGTDLAHGANIPLIGINMGHVGFLAELEADHIWDALDRLVEGDFTIEDRMTIDVDVISGDRVRTGSWAINELSLEKASHRGILEATLAIDNRPVSSYACDGMFVSTPTGSTAYAFSAGAPVVWPQMEAMLVMPNNAHGLFTRPLVVSPESLVTIDVNCGRGLAMAYLDGYRGIRVENGERILARKGSRPVRMIRLDTSPFADKLVRKFHLPVKGWRDVLRHTAPHKNDPIG